MQLYFDTPNNLCGV